MDDTRILIVAKDPEAGAAYAAAVAEAGAGHDLAGSFAEMAALAVERPYNGLIIDILTLVRCSKEEKVIAYECINIYPVLRVKWEAKQKKITLGPLEQSFSPDLDPVLKFFIENRCQEFQARHLRRHKRKAVTLNVLVSGSENFFDGETWPSFTVTVSKGGAFLHTMRPLHPGEKLWLRFVDVPGEPVIPATVRWALEWGVSRAVPGVGLRFDDRGGPWDLELERVLNL